MDLEARLSRRANFAVGLTVLTALYSVTLWTLKLLFF